MKLLNGAASLLNCRHLYKREALGALRLFVTDNFGIANLADTFKELEKITFRSVKR